MLYLQVEHFTDAAFKFQNISPIKFHWMGSIPSISTQMFEVCSSFSVASGHHYNI